MPYSTAFLSLRDAAVDALRHRRLSSAIEAMRGQLLYLNSAERFQDTLETLHADYGRLLHFLHLGGDKSMRADLYEEFTQQAYALAEAIHREWQWTEGHRYGAEEWQRLHRQPDSPTLEEVLHQGDGREIFHYLWTSDAWTPQHRQQAVDWLLERGVSVSLKATLISALMMRLLASFDAEMHLFLFDILLPKDMECSVEEEAMETLLAFHPHLYERALVALVFVQMQHGEANSVATSDAFPAPLSLFPDHQQLYRSLNCSEFRDTMLELQKMLLMAAEAPRYAKRMEEVLLPELDKMSGVLKTEDIAPGGLFDEFQNNPQLKAANEANMRIMNEVFMARYKGIDTGFGTFRQLQSKYTFFRDAANWFMPFERSHPAVLQSKINDDTFEYGFSHKTCDTDRFLHLQEYLKIAGAETEVEKIRGKRGGAAKAFSVEVHDGEFLRKEAEYRFHKMKGYLYDVYRFFHLYYHRREHENPFRSSPYLYEYPVFSWFFDRKSVAEELAKDLFEKEDDVAALPLLRKLSDTEENLRRLGLVCQRQGLGDEAISAFEKLVLLSDSEENVLLLADACRMFGRYEDAVTNYIHLEMHSPDDLHLLFHLSTCFLHLGYFEWAEERLRHAEELYPDHPAVIRQLAWCLMKLENFQEATSYHDRIILGDPTANDFYNAGHCAWLSDDVSAAIAYYGKCLSAQQGDPYFPNDFFDADRDHLLEWGLSEADLAMMLDLLNMHLVD